MMARMSDRRRPNPWLAISIALAIYIGVYLFVAEPKVYRQTGIDPTTGQNLFHVKPRYATDSSTLEIVFAPAHRLDRLIRRERWTTIEHSSGRKWKNP
jgi:hypothetical protein